MKRNNQEQTSFHPPAPLSLSSSSSSSSCSSFFFFFFVLVFIFIACARAARATQARRARAGPGAARPSTGARAMAAARPPRPPPRPPPPRPPPARGPRKVFHTWRCALKRGADLSRVSVSSWSADFAPHRGWSPGWVRGAGCGARFSNVTSFTRLEVQRLWPFWPV